MSVYIAGNGVGIDGRDDSNYDSGCGHNFGKASKVLLNSTLLLGVDVTEDKLATSFLPI